MVFRIFATATPFFIALSLMVNAGQARSEGLPEGITATVIAEYPSKVPTVKKVRLVKVVMQPGALFDNIEVKSEEYCELKRGALTHVSHDTGVVDLYTAGARWAPPKGSYHTVTNTGDDVAEMWVYQLIVKDAADGDKM